MYSAKCRQKQLAAQSLSNIVSENRKVENYQRDLWKIEANSADRAMARVRVRQQQLLATEMQQKEREEREQQQKQEYEKQKAISDELYERERQKFLDEKLRQQIRESNQELRELESQLKAAYVAKGLAAQLREREALALQEKLNLQNEMREMEKARISNEQFWQQERERDAEKKRELQKALHEQIINSRLKHQVIFEEFLKEKRYLDEIVKRIQDEQMEEIQRKMMRKERTKQEMDEFRKAKERFQEQQRIEMEEENQRIMKYCLEREAKLVEEAKIKEKQNQEREALNERMVSSLNQMIEEADKRERLLQELYEIEKDEQEVLRFRKELEEKIRIRIETRLALDMQRANNQLKKDSEAAEERAFMEDQMRHLAEKDRLDQLSNENRRRKQMEHRQAVRDLIEKRRAERVQKMTEMVKEQEMHEMEKEHRQKLVEEERIKLLKEHAKALLGFLPNGILKELQNN
ncbi:meiosis-specific nuclear structural protein 1-like [Culicoides brevitarsis]|uniref:meiosis-specific nuclear structural protein 1-like n=1 Tax=Culicoides brevitarsis TaxID=469753 RepID=UPI00307CAB23